MASHCSAFLPGGDGCLGPGFNTPASGPQLPFAWWQQSPAQARARLQALLAVAPASCEASIGCIRCSSGLGLRDWKSPNTQSSRARSPDEQP